MAELNKMTVHALAEGLAEKRFSAVEIAQDCLDAVKNGDDKIHAFLHIGLLLFIKTHVVIADYV